MKANQLARMLANEALELHALCIVNSEQMQPAYTVWRNHLQIKSFPAFVDGFVQTWTYTLFVSKWHSEVDEVSFSFAYSVQYVRELAPQIKSLFSAETLGCMIRKKLNVIVEKLTVLCLQESFSEDPSVYFYELFLQYYSPNDRNQKAAQNICLAY